MRVFKALVYAVAIALVFPGALCEWIARRLAGRDVFFDFQSEFVSLIPGKTGRYIRNAYWHLTLRNCPLNGCFLTGTLFSHSEASVGQRVYIGTRCIIGMADIGDDTMLADHVSILSGGHQHGTSGGGGSFQSQQQKFTRVTIGQNCWLGANVVVMADIGDNCVIGAGSVVTKPVPANSVAVGNPARVIRTNTPGAAPDSDEGADSPRHA
jgi:acetyltransferase-like isoleucine patch superfamily enzyme